MRRFFFAAQDEVCRRFNNRKNQFLFRDMLLKMLEGIILRTRSSLRRPRSVDAPFY